MRYSKGLDKGGAFAQATVAFIIVTVVIRWGLGLFIEDLFPIRLPVAIIVAAVCAFYVYTDIWEQKKKWWDAFEKASPEEQMRMEEERFQEEERRKKEEERMRKEREERERKAAEEERKRKAVEEERFQEKKRRMEELLKRLEREDPGASIRLEEMKREREEERKREEDRKKREEWKKRQVMEKMRWF